MEARNLIELVSHIVENHPDRIAAVWRTNDQEESLTYLEFWNLIRKFALGLEQLGVRPGTKVAILANNHPYWLICDLAVLSLGGVSVPISPYLSKQQIISILDRVDIEMVIADTKEHYHLRSKISSFHLSMVVLFDQDNQKKQILSFHTVCQIGEKIATNWRYEFIRKSDLATIVHTLGTTGSPKGVMLTHQNLIHTIQSISRIVPISEHDICTSLYPLAYLPERVFNYLYAIYHGATIIYTEPSLGTLQKLQLIQPTILLSSPQIFEEFYFHIKEEGYHSWVSKQLFDWSMEVAEELAVYTDKGYRWPIPKELKKKYDRADQYVFSKIRKQTGGNLRLMLSFGRSLDKETSRFFSLIGLPILECYGLTESSSIIACNHPIQIKHGTVGQALPDTKIRLLTNGELLIKSPSVMLGYYKRPEQTAQTIIDGWLHTGDFAHIDEKGNIQILPQPKRTFFLLTGKKIDPEPMENSIVKSNYIHQAFIIGNQKRYVTALIIPDFNMLSIYAEEYDLPSKDRRDLLQLQAIQNLIQHEIDKALIDFSEEEQPEKFVLLDEELRLEKGELTIHGLVYADEVEEKYRELIEAMYI